VNTAARMESKGIPGRIHVSEATAEALKALGKAAWLTKCEEKVDVKGKGLMQTYFAEPAREIKEASSDYHASFEPTEHTGVEGEGVEQCTATDLCGT
jgi:Adenylate and Guanylate cyclase catalytic domain